MKVIGLNHNKNRADNRRANNRVSRMKMKKLINSILKASVLVAKKIHNPLSSKTPMHQDNQVNRKYI